jgi:hypothetical protein
MYYALLVVDDDGCPRMFATTHRAAHATRVAARDPATRRPALARLRIPRRTTHPEVDPVLDTYELPALVPRPFDTTGMKLFADEVASELH